MQASDVTFRKIVVDDTLPVDQQATIEIVEIKFPDGKVSALPATAVNAESGQRYCDRYAEKYAAFQNTGRADKVEDAVKPKKKARKK